MVAGVWDMGGMAWRTEWSSCASDRAPLGAESVCEGLCRVLGYIVSPHRAFSLKQEAGII